MDDQTIFNNKNQGQNNPPSEGTSSRITAQDLYGPSGVVNTDVQNQQISQTSTVSTETLNKPEPLSPPVQPLSVPVENMNTFSEVEPLTGSMPPSGINSYLKNKKILAAAIVFIVLILIIFIGILSRLFGGGGNKGITNATLTYWGLWEESKTMQSTVGEFQKKYPGIKINYIKQDPQKYKERLITRIKNNTEAPDIFSFHNSWVPTLTSSSDNVLLPLPQEVIKPDEFQKIYYPVILRDMTKNGAIYGLPQGVDVLALFINKDIFDAAGVKVPKTWEEFNTIVRQLTVKEKNGIIQTSGVALGTFDNVTHAPDIISLIMATNGIDLSSLEKQPEFVKESLLHYTSFAKGEEGVWSNSLGSSRDMFAQGKAAMYFGYSWDIFAIQAISKDLNFSVHPVPYLPTGSGSQTKITIASYWANGLSTQTKHQKEALLFIKFLSEKETMQKIFTEASKSRLFGMPYPRRDMASMLADDPILYPFVEQANNATSTIFSSDTNDTLYNSLLNDYLGNAVREIYAGGSVDTATKTFLQGVSQVQAQSLQ